MAGISQRVADASKIEEIGARLALAHIEGNEDAIAYSFRYISNKASNKRRKNQKKRVYRKKNKNMRNQYEAGLASAMSVLSPMDKCALRRLLKCRELYLVLRLRQMGHSYMIIAGTNRLERTRILRHHRVHPVWVLYLLEKRCRSSSRVMSY